MVIYLGSTILINQKNEEKPLRRFVLAALFLV